MPQGSEVSESRPDLRKEKFSKVPLDCIMLDQPIKPATSPPLGLFPTYCFDPGAASLRLSYQFGSQLMVRNQLGKFGGRTVPMSITLFDSNVRRASARIVALNSGPGEHPDFDTTDGMGSLAGSAPNVAGSVMAGHVLKKVVPIYPEKAKRSETAGTVLLHAIIGRDGHVYSLRLVSTPDPDLAMSALTAVRQWTYSPYLLNGEPTEVDTTITVNFAISY